MYYRVKEKKMYIPLIISGTVINLHSPHQTAQRCIAMGCPGGSAGLIIGCAGILLMSRPKRYRSVLYELIWEIPDYSEISSFLTPC
jgi:hypothetical protein